jgi:hypothetical protein
MNRSISHSREEETPEAKARWFRSLTIEERLRVFCEWNRFILRLNPRIADIKHDRPPREGVQVLSTA